MGSETKKALQRRALDPLWIRILSEPGRKLDIGGGPDPLPGCENWDSSLGRDGIKLDGVPDGSIQLVYSSHCLEHLPDPVAALTRWWQVLRPGGWLWAEIPDAYLYEHGVFPSRFNSDHKWMFSAYRAYPKVTQPEKHIQVIDLIKFIPDCALWRLNTIDRGYDYGKPDTEDQTQFDVETAVEFCLQKVA